MEGSVPAVYCSLLELNNLPAGSGPKQTAKPGGLSGLCQAWFTEERSIKGLKCHRMPKEYEGMV